ncbi:hypothetical protein QG37_05735 [Candidozyma auris]|uniref:Uncharacterized protein n=1 Tax=Candidozyma auris TaxID=498019 RepID=A0A0L0NT60_CANAR|nr:hypothetical protein QG37_05735 [[Candida] auris]
MSKAFTSKSKAHFESYSLVKRLQSFILSFALFQAITTYVVALSNYFNDQVVSRFPFVVKQLSAADELVDGLVFGNVDKAVAFAADKAKQTEQVAQAYKKKGTDLLLAYKKKGEDAVGVYLKARERVRLKHR